MTIDTVECTITALVEWACDESAKMTTVLNLRKGSDSSASIGPVGHASFEPFVSCTECDEYNCYKDAHEYISIASD